jgi:hypothetical protein
MDDQAIAQSVEDRMLNLLNAEDETPEAEPEIEDQEQETEESESEEEQTEEPQTILLKRGDEEVEVDLAEAKNLAQMGYDYTKKTQEVAEQRKQVEMHAQAVKAQEQALQVQAETQQTLIKDMAKVESLSDQISQYEDLNWSALSDSDPVQAQKLWIQYQTLTNQRTQAQQALQAKYHQLTESREQNKQIRLEQAKVDLLKLIPDWSAEKATAVREAAKVYGFSDAELDSVTDPRMVKVLSEAAAYRKLQTEKKTIDKKVADKPPVVKPGAKDTKRADKADYAKQREALRKSGNGDLAAKLIERML